jgi:ABC-2 type transport system permease protein
MRSTPPFTTSLADGAAAMGAAYRVGLASAVASAPVLVGRAIFYGVCLMVLVAFWDKVGSHRIAGTFGAHLPLGGMAIYVGVTEWITLSAPAVHLKLEDDIRSGALEPHLLRPKNYLVQLLAGQAGGMTARLVMLGAAGLVLLALSGRPWPAGFGLVYVAVLGVIGTAIGLLILTIVGLSAFWLRRVLPALLVVQKLLFLLGGLFAPISFYPGWLHTIAAWSPFAANMAFAGQAALTPSASDFAWALAAEVFWFAALAGLIALIWRAGLAKTLRQGV